MFEIVIHCKFSSLNELSGKIPVHYCYTLLKNYMNIGHRKSVEPHRDRPLQTSGAASGPLWVVCAWFHAMSHPRSRNPPA